MIFGKVIGNIVSTMKDEVYRNKKVYIVRLLDSRLKEIDETVIGIDTIGAGKDDIVLLSDSPGAARDYFGLKRCPISTLILGVVRECDVHYS